MVSGLFQYIFTATSNFEKSSKHNESSISQQIVNKSVDTSKRTEVQSMNKIPFSTCIRANSWAWTFIFKEVWTVYFIWWRSFITIFHCSFCVVELIARELAFLSLFLLAVLWVVNLLDLVITIINQSKNKQPEN